MWLTDSRADSVFFNSLMTVLGLTFKTRAVSRIPLPFTAICLSFHFRHTPLIIIIQQKRLDRAVGLLTEIALLVILFFYHA
jgi:hypothetical protein